MITEQNPILETTFNVDVNKDKRTEKAKGVDKLLPYQSDNEDDYDDDGHGSTNTMGREEVKQSIEVKVVMGGPVTPLFQVRTEVPHQFLSFSQRRKKGYRSNYEFDKKRVLVGNEKNIQILGYSQEDYEPYHIITHSLDQQNSMGATKTTQIT